MAIPDLYAIREAHGGTVYDGGRRWIGPGPGHSQRDASLSVLVSETGRAVVHSFAGDPFLACAAHLGIERQASPASRAELAAIRRAREVEHRRINGEARAFCWTVWAAAGPINATPAETYLWCRGLLYEGDALRFHPFVPRSRRAGGAPPHAAMLAAVRNARGEHVGLHATYLTADARKAFGDRSRLMFGPVAGSAVRLARMAPDGVLGVAEGIETAGAFASLHGVPTWAALSTAGLTRFEVPLGVRKLVIAADSDDTGAGLKAARVLAERAKARCAVVIAAAPEGMDWADAMAEAADA